MSGIQHTFLRSPALWRDINLLGLAITRVKVEDREFPVVQYLLDAGSDPNSVVYHGRNDNPITGLLAALEIGSIGLVELLLKYGAAVNQEAKGGILRTPLQQAAEMGRLDMVELLLSRGADVNAAPAYSRGGTALQLAAITGNCTIATMLLDKDADVHMLPSVIAGRWPLEAAAEHGRLSIVKLLWEAGEGRFADSICERAMELAEEQGHLACREFIASLRAGRQQSGAWGWP